MPFAAPAAAIAPASWNEPPRVKRPISKPSSDVAPITIGSDSDAEREHHEPSCDPADDEARQGTGGRPDEHGGRDVAGVVPDGDARRRRLWRDRGHRRRG